MDVQPLTPVIGAEIHGVELARLDDAAFADVEAALLAHQVLFFRDQELDIDEHKASVPVSVRCTSIRARRRARRATRRS